MFIEEPENLVSSCPSSSWTSNWKPFTIVKFTPPSRFLFKFSHVILDCMAQIINVSFLIHHGVTSALVGTKTLDLFNKLFIWKNVICKVKGLDNKIINQDKTWVCWKIHACPNHPITCHNNKKYWIHHVTKAFIWIKDLEGDNVC